MDEEEPTAAACISQARNKGQAVALETHEFTAISTLQGLMIPANGAMAQTLTYDAFLNKARDMLGVQIVDGPDFHNIVDMVHRLGRG